MTRKENVLLFVCGSILLLTQYIAVREIGSTLYATEFVIVFSTLIILLGPSIAYAVVHRLNRCVFTAWGMASFIVALSMPVSIRRLVAASDPATETPVIILIFIVGSLFLTGFFSAILPSVATGKTFGKNYAFELAGAVFALVLIALCPTWNILLILYWFLLTVALDLAFSRRLMTVAAAIIATLAVATYPGLNKSATEAYYANYWRYDKPVLLETHYSPYQRIDIIDDTSGRSLMLDGLTYFDTDQLFWFNYYMAELPGKLVPPKPGRKALVFGSGSFSSTKMLAQNHFDVTTVELDADVARLGRKHFQVLGQNDPLHLVIDDARHYVTTLPDKSFDIIVLDVPAPHHIQTALLYTPSFFRQVRRCLREGGVASISNCGSRYNDDFTLPITAAAASVFEDIMAVTGESADTTTLYAGTKLPFTKTEMIAELGTREKKGFQVFDCKRIKNLVVGIEPNSEENLSALFHFARAVLPGNH